MNKIYNTVWNESTGMWVVTSELSSKGGQRPRKIKQAVLAGLIACVLLPAMPAQAASYDNQTLGSGGTSSSMGLNSGDTATNTTINSGGGQYVYSGGSAMSTTINGGGQHVYGGGSATDTTINSGGYQYVADGGNAMSTTINSGGDQYVYGSGSGSGSATNTTINSGGYQDVAGGGSAKNTTINNGGYQDVAGGGSAADTTINSGGLQYVSSGGRATSTIINNGGRQSVRSGGSATDTVLNSGGTLKVDADGTATAITQHSGGAIVTNTSAVLDGINRNGSFSIAGGSASGMLLENGGLLEVYDAHDATDTWVGRGGTLHLSSGAVLKGTTTVAEGGTLLGGEVNNQRELHFLNNSPAAYSGQLTGAGSLSVDGGRLTLSGTLTQDAGVFINSGGVLNMDTLQATADVTAQSGTILNLTNGSTLAGRILDDGNGAGDVAVKEASVWSMTGDSVVNYLALDGGTINFRGGAVSPSPGTTLTAESLSGRGTFLMNTDIASHTGDMLNVTGNATGNFVLDIKNTGREPVSAGAPLQVVHTGGGDAGFTLNGGKVDAGTWEYSLSKENTDWYLKADVTLAGNPDPTPDSGKSEAGNADPGRTASPVRRTTKSTDAVLGMATAPAYVFNSELQSLRFRHSDITQNTRSPGGVWGRYMGSDNRISGASGSGYTLSQSGMETGGDKVFELDNSQLAVGAFVSYTDNSISHNRGGNSTIGSTGGGLYTTWFDNEGYYVDGVLKFNRFSNELRTQMSDGTAVKGDYSQNGYGGSLEAGKTFSLNENTWVQPYVRTTAFRAEAKDINLDNGMKARIETTKSLQGEAGVNLGMSLDVAGTTVSPYLTAAISHEFSDNNKVRINNRYNFTNNISGTTEKYGTGVSAQLTPNASVWAEASYQKGGNIESSVTGSVGFRINF
ncbi:autotransporter outer membrane beta-barrel domain-containing protein [Yersinia mollaretii]|uniref:autotransporter outer membrane beta-barrel domain-containing protein n=1 Tax=Yersinia mollaretii TaxID=33060 RepID=UPI0005E7B295|nr:autotransporter outer membrane beta-barrel domain-containing protein [Yersinia mollaretii]CNE92540.1 putative autotransporter [Yersinia mollaretii]